MTPRHRKAFFLGALFLFTIVAPVLILGASGYRYDFQEQELVPTGTLVLKSYPEGAKILINRKEAANRTPAEIQGCFRRGIRWRFRRRISVPGAKRWRFWGIGSP